MTATPRFQILGRLSADLQNPTVRHRNFFSELVNEIQAEAEHQQKQESVKHGNAGVQFLGNSK